MKSYTIVVSSMFHVKSCKLKSYLLHSIYDLVDTLSLQHAHDANKQRNIDERTHTLVKCKLGQRIGDVQTLLLRHRFLRLSLHSVLCSGRGAARKPSLEEILPHAIYRCVEDGISNEVDDRCQVDFGIRFLG
jgi:hypothetical protein